MNFNIRSLAPSETAFMQLRDIEGTPQFAEDGSAPGIEYYGPGTREYRAAQSKYFTKLKKLVDNKKDNDIDAVTAVRIEYLAEVTKGLVGFDFDGGAKALYRDIEFSHIFEDGFKFVGEQGNFKKSFETS